MDLNLLRCKIIVWLEAHKEEAHTVYAVTTALGLHHAQTRAVLQWLASHDPRILLIEGKPQKYKYAPERKRIEQNPSCRDAVIQGLIINHLWDVPQTNFRQLEKHLRAVLHHIGRDVLIRCLAHLKATGKVSTKPGPDRSTLYTLP